MLMKSPSITHRLPVIGLASIRQPVLHLARGNHYSPQTVCWSSKIDKDDSEVDDDLLGPVNDNPLRVQMMEERQLRTNGLLAGTSFLSLSVILGCVLGFFDPLVFLGLGVAGGIMLYTRIESCNEYSNPLPSSSFQVQESTIPNAGMGLFAGTNIAKSTYLFDYEGEVLNEEQYFERYPKGDGRYVAQVDTGILGIGEPIYIDGVDPEQSNLARYMNSASENANVYWKKQAMGAQAGSMHFYSLRDIQDGEELFFDYGDNYWQAADRIDST